ncbi:MAG: hypothetical protein AAF391_08030, partial [Bacteroidota bacterium]
MIEILLDYIKSTRIGDWELHLSSMERMLPWIHAYDRVNYARHFTYCWARLKELPHTMHDVYNEFQIGNFCVKRTEGSFNMLPPDQVIEQTINKEQNGPGGIIGNGISTSVGAVQRWVFSSHVVAEMNTDFKQSINVDLSSKDRKDLGKKRKIRDECNVKDCYEFISNWSNPFEASEQLVAIHSGIVPNEKVIADLERAEEVGKVSVGSFREKRIYTTDEKFNDPIKKNKLLTFGSKIKKPLSKSKGLVMALRSDRETFARMMLISKDRDISMRDTLKFELTSIPLSLANADESLSKTVKSKLFAALSESISIADHFPENIPPIFDGMVLFQKLPPTLSTFGEVADYLLGKVLSTSCRISFFVTDYYLPFSLKSLERKRRSTIGSLRIKILNRNQQRPKSWGKYLQHPDNKVELVRFLLDDWSQNEDNVTKLINRELYVTCEDEAYCIRVNR